MIRSSRYAFLVIGVFVGGIFIFVFHAQLGLTWITKMQQSLLKADTRRAEGALPYFPKAGAAVGQTLPILPLNNKNSVWSEPQSMKNMRKYGLVEKLSKDQLASASSEKLSLLYHSYLDNTDIICHRKLRMGNVGDGGWEICDDIQWRPIAPCIIYSFGINRDFSFDDNAGQLYGCDVFSFDPSMKNNTHRRSDRIMFYKVGIGGTSGHVNPNSKGWILHSLSNIRQMLNHTEKVIDVLKMDVEQAEWPSMRTAVNERQLDSVRQLLIEFHSGDSPTELRQHLMLLSDLEKAGFRRFYVSKNFHCQRPAVAFPVKRTSCYEIHYVNSLFIRP